MLADPDVHIVVPTTGERREMLAVSVASVLAQTVPTRVTVVVRPGADVTGLWPNGRVEVLVQSRPGLSAAVNEAWERDGWSSRATGWLGDDDALPPWSVERALLSLEERPDASMVCGRCLVVDDAGRPLRVVRNGRLGARLVGYGPNLLAQPGCLFRTPAVRSVGGLDEDLRLAMDVDLFTRLRQWGPVVATDEQLGVFRQHAGGLSTDHRKAAAREARAVQRRARSGVRDAVAHAGAAVLGRVVARVTTRLPPAPEHYWRPATSP